MIVGALAIVLARCGNPFLPRALGIESQEVSGMLAEADLRDFGSRTRLFPLSGVVLFPHVVMPLHIFEPRYRQMTADALAGDQLITLVQTLSRSDESPNDKPLIEQVGCVGRIIRHESLLDGRYNLLLLGRKRVRLVRELEVDTPYRQAEVELVQDPTQEAGSVELAEELLRLFRQASTLDDEMMAVLDHSLSLGILTDIITHALAIAPGLKQVFLDEPSAARRAAGLIRLLETLTQSARGPAHRSAPPFSLN